MPETSTQTKTTKTRDSEYFKKYYQNHKDKYVHEKTLCQACKCDVMKNDYNRHCKSKKHIKNVICL